MLDVTAFTGDVPKFYDTKMGPVIFEPYGEETAKRIHDKAGQKVLEIAAGTGRVTRHLAKNLPNSELTITDLNQDMLDIAKTKVDHANASFRVADAQELPFPANTFEVVVAQFSVMFYPDKDLGQREALRVLKTGGKYIFAVWGTFEENPWAGKLHALLGSLKPEDPPMFLTVPFGYNDKPEIKACLERAGFTNINIDPVTKDFYCEHGRDYAEGNVFGTPMAAGLTEAGIRELQPIVDKVTEMYEKEFGEPMRSTMTAYIVTAEKP